MRNVKPLCFFVLVVFSVLLFSDVYVYAQEWLPNQKGALEKELKSMLIEVRTLRALESERSLELKSWQEKSILLETKLQNVLQSLQNVSQNLESSEMTVIELQKLVQELRLQLTELKKEYLSVCKSLEYQKKMKNFWQATALGFMTLAVGEGIIIICK